MKSHQSSVGILVAILVIQGAVGQIFAPAATCDSDACTIEKNCRCSTASSPIAEQLDEYPQLVSLTFSEGVTKDNYERILTPLLLANERTNPDQNPIGATFFVPHEYTNYVLVNQLYNFGFEIGVNSISNNPLQIYWRTATEEVLEQEFNGQKKIISKFANIPIEAIQGVRTPQLQLSGNNSIKAYRTAELAYDSSWPSLPARRLFPYTLDYSSNQDCLLGAECPNEAFPGFWVLPINDLQGDGNNYCNTISACTIQGTADVIGTWLTKEIDKVRNSTKAPMTLIVTSDWFNSTKNSFEGFKLFLDNMKDRKDVFLVSQKQVLDFVKEPKTLSEFQTDGIPEQRNCNERSCQLDKGDEIRNMDCCISCPEVYPWLGNPDGTRNV